MFIGRSLPRLVAVCMLRVFVASRCSSVTAATIDRLAGGGGGGGRGARDFRRSGRVGRDRAL